MTHVLPKLQAISAAQRELPQGARHVLRVCIGEWTAQRLPATHLVAFARGVAWQSPSLTRRFAADAYDIPPTELLSESEIQASCSQPASPEPEISAMRRSTSFRRVRHKTTLWILMKDHPRQTAPFKAHSALPQDLRRGVAPGPAPSLAQAPSFPAGPEGDCCQCWPPAGPPTPAVSGCSATKDAFLAAAAAAAAAASADDAEGGNEVSAGLEHARRAGPEGRPDLLELLRELKLPALPAARRRLLRSLLLRRPAAARFLPVSWQRERTGASDADY